jgi:ribonucleoside-diphosphate reductase alpha chain
MTAGAYDDGSLGEVFIKMSKQGSTLAGVMDAYSIAISIGLQYGVPLEAYIDKFLNMRFEPAGLTDDADIRMAQSVMDYIFRRLALDFLSFEARSALGIYSADERSRQLETGSYTATELETAADTGVADVEVQSLSQSAPVIEVTPAPMGEVHSSAELMERITGKASDAPMCFTCGIKMRPSGSCYACEGCGSTSGCS